jgi:hypothetical protein
MPLELGPVLRFETRVVARRKGPYVFRVAFCLALAVLLAVGHRAVEMNLKQGASPATVRALISGKVASVLAVLHLVVALLVAPVAASDAFSDVCPFLLGGPDWWPRFGGGRRI